MEDKNINELINKLFSLTIEIEDKEKEIERHGKFPPLNLQLDVANKSYKMYEVCKEYFNR
jgi:hypothetical protein